MPLRLVAVAEVPDRLGHGHLDARVVGGVDRSSSHSASSSSPSRAMTLRAAALSGGSASASTHDPLQDVEPLRVVLEEDEGAADGQPGAGRSPSRRPCGGRRWRASRPARAGRRGPRRGSTSAPGSCWRSVGDRLGRGVVVDLVRGGRRGRAGGGGAPGGGARRRRRRAIRGSREEGGVGAVTVNRSLRPWPGPGIRAPGSTGPLHASDTRRRRHSGAMVNASTRVRPGSTRNVRRTSCTPSPWRTRIQTPPSRIGLMSSSSGSSHIGRRGG